MTALGQILRLIWRGQRPAAWRAAALAAIVLAMGVALLGLSGWFIIAAAGAGLAGAGAVFDVFRPSAAIRFLALGRAAARYGERVLSHDATLRALETLRAQVLAGLVAAPFATQARLRGAQAVNRVIADVDALDGLSLRLALPAVAGAIVVAAAGVAIGALWGPGPALVVSLGYGLGGAALFHLASRRALPLSRRAAAAAQAFRTRLITLIEARRDLAATSRLVAAQDGVAAAEARRRQLRRALDRIERRTAAASVLLSGAIVAVIFGLGLHAAQSGQISAATAMMAVLAALALSEALAPLRRAVGEVGRMADAARRVAPVVAPLAPAPVAAAANPPAPDPAAPVLVAHGLSVAHPGTAAPIITDLSVRLAPGEVLALSGRSGAGKSSLLQVLAGLTPPLTGSVQVLGCDLRDGDEATLRRHIGLVPQRVTLLSGTIASNLRLARPEATDSELMQVLRAVALDRVIAARGGLAMALGPRGDGLSGGEARRLALARAALRQPALMLLDEPTEGLDAATARSVLAGLRAMLPHTAFVIASHRPEEAEGANCRIGVE